MNKKLILIIAAIVLLVVVLVFINQKSDLKTEDFEPNSEYLVDPSEIHGGGPPKGGIGVDKGIPALAEKNIEFVTLEEADQWIEDNELVLALVYDDVVRVYPLQIMVFHEIANDEINGKPLLITYCPLCGSGIAYERTVEVNGEKKETRFGTSGKLYNSNLIMYDELTDTYWTQIDGLAITGELIGQELNEISIDTVVWRDWKESEIGKNSEVLSQNTGISRNYGTDPYGSYYEDSYLLFTPEETDNRIHPKTVIFGIELDGKYKAYKEDDLIELGTIKDEIFGVEIKRKKSGIIEITNLDTGEEIVKERDFWFAWYAFHPDTGLWES